MKIIFGNDHGGYELKVFLTDYLKQQVYQVEDVGSFSEEIVRYPYYAAKVAGKVAADPEYRGILICSTGIGMSIIANKFRGIRAALCTTSYQAGMTSAHNHSNILCLGGKCIGRFEAIDIVENWLNTPYEGGRHDISLSLINRAETTNFASAQWNPDIPETQ